MEGVRQSGDEGTGLETRRKSEVKKPNMYRVVLLNDDIAGRKITQAMRMAEAHDYPLQFQVEADK